MSGLEDMDDEAYEEYIKIRETQERIIDMRKKGKSYKEIAEIVGWSLETVTTFLTTNQFSPDYKRRIIFMI